MPAESTGRKSQKENYREILTEMATPAFNRLREWRTQRARKDAVPPYVVFTNRQLAEIAVRNPESLSALSAVEGVGNAKLSQYGKEVLACLRPPEEPQEKTSGEAPEPSPPPPADPEVPPDGP
jgi:ATP-dependent DNA helicase RecQ